MTGIENFKTEFPVRKIRYDQGVIFSNCLGIRRKAEAIIP
jgi:hypothetical protein